MLCDMPAMNLDHLDPQMAAFLRPVLESGMLGNHISDEERRQRFEVLAPMMWDPAQLPVDAIEERTIPGVAGDIVIRVYRPPVAAGPRPLLLYFHGGGFTAGSIGTADPMARFLCREACCIVVSSDYRLAPEHPFPAAVEDCWAAARWVGERVAELGGDPARFAVGGDAPGATLAAAVAQMAAAAGSPRFVFQLLLSPATDMSVVHPSRKELADDPIIPADVIEQIYDKYAPSPADRFDPRCSPLLANDLASVASAYVLTAEFDPLRDEGRAYAEKLDAAGVDVTYECWPGVLHNFFSMSDHLDAAKAAMADVAAALTRGLR